MPRFARRPRTRCALRGLSAALAVAVAGAGTAGGPRAAAASDCHVIVEHAGGLLERRATVGEVDRRAVPALHRLLNRGPHDVRATFDRLDPRVLQRGQAEPAHGRLDTPVTLLTIECLPARAASVRGGLIGPLDPPRAHARRQVASASSTGDLP